MNKPHEEASAVPGAPADATQAGISYSPDEDRRGASVSRGVGAQIMREAFARWGARIGLAWILILIVLAVFAPLIANSHPLAIQYVDSDQLHYPLFEHLHWVDVVLVIAFFVGGFLWFLPRVSGGIKLLVFVVLVTAASISSALLVSPPELPRYSQHREAIDAGQVEWAVFAPIPYSPNDRFIDVRKNVSFRPPELEQDGHWLGTDQLKQDLASRMIHAARIALSIGFISTGIAAVIGIIIGGLMGYFSGVVDILGMRLLEIFQAVPALFLLLTFVAFFGANIYIMMVIIGLTSWPGFARFIRAEFLKLRAMDYVQAGKALGLPLRSILFKHMLPNGVAPLLVSASFGVAGAIIAEATLSFLGLGLKEDPSWGQMLNEATAGAGGRFNWWIATFPGLAIFLTVLAYNLIGEALRDAIDPHLKKVAS